MSKIRIGVFGPTGKMGASVIDQLKNFKNLELVSLCEEKNHKMIGKKISGITVESNIEIFLKDLEVIILGILILPWVGMIQFIDVFAITLWF